MHTEHLYNVRLAWVVSGWLVSIVLASLLMLVFISLELVGADPVAEATWTLVAVALGFAGGGFSIGYRAAEAPILNGVAIGLTSLVAWFPLNFLVDFVFDLGPWAALTPSLTVGILLVQMVGAVGGAWLGRFLAFRGETQLEE